TGNTVADRINLSPCLMPRRTWLDRILEPRLSEPQLKIRSTNTAAFNPHANFACRRRTKLDALYLDLSRCRDRTCISRHRTSQRRALDRHPILFSRRKHKKHKEAL